MDTQKIAILNKVYDDHASLIYGISEGISINVPCAESIFCKTFEKLPFEKHCRNSKSEARSTIMRLICTNENMNNHGAGITNYKSTKSENFPLLFKLYVENESIHRVSEQERLSKSEIGKKLLQELKKFRITTF